MKNINIKIEFREVEDRRGFFSPWVSDIGSFSAEQKVPTLRNLSYLALSHTSQMGDFQSLSASHIDDYEDCKQYVQDINTNCLIVYDRKYTYTGRHSGYSSIKTNQRVTLNLDTLPASLYAVYGSTRLNGEEYKFLLVAVFTSEYDRSSFYPNPYDFDLHFTTLKYTN